MNGKSRILVVDDEPALRELYSLQLRARGYEVWEASNGEIGLQMVREQRPDLVLLDVMLPDMNGIEVCRKIKGENAFKDVFVVLVSGGAITPSDMVVGFDAGADEYLLKPLDLNEFLARIRTIVRLQETTAALRASQEHYRGLIEILPNAMFQIDLGGRLVTINQEAMRMLGFSSTADLLQKNIFDFLPVEQHERVRGDIAMTLDKEILRDLDYRFEGRSGNEVWFEVSATTAKNSKGEVVGLVAVVRDTTERRQAEEKLNESQRRQKAILDNITDPAWLRDETGRFLDCNEAFAKVFGWAREEIVGRTLSELAPSAAGQRAQEDLEVMESLRPAVFEQCIIAADGRPLWFETSKSPVVDGQGRVIGTVGIGHDVTERKRTEEELRTIQRRIIEAQEAERLRVARELHDGVNQIIASAKMRLRKVVESDSIKISPAAREIISRCDRLLIQALEENRRIARNLRPLDLDELGFTEATLSLCKEVQSRGKLMVDCRISNLDRHLPPAVELGLFRIMQEALGNAERHAEAERVDVHLALEQDTLTLIIRDDGRGFNSSGERSGEPKRRGFGLTNMRERALSLGGSCEVVSGPNQGTAITVNVPCDKSIS